MAKLPTDKLDAMDKRHQAIEDQMAQAPDPETIVKLSKEHSDLQPVVEKIREYKSAVAGLADAEEMIASGDKELIELAELERDELKEKIEEYTQEIRLLLLPKDDADDKARFWRCERELVVMKLRFLRATCSACISAMLNLPVGK